MSSVALLDNIRRLNSILHKKNNGKVVFNDICAAIGSSLCANVLVFSKKGKLLGLGISKNVPSLAGLLELNVGDFADRKFNDRLKEISCTKENVFLEAIGFSEMESRNFQAMVTPIDVSGERFGTLFIYRPASESGNGSAIITGSFGIDDIILCEYGATVVGLEILRSVSEESAEEERRANNVRNALGALSGTEIEALCAVFDELSGCEGVLVASRVADRVGITRSVIVNALRKLESAEIIESKSAGMKGTYIKVVNDLIFDELEDIKDNK